MTIRRNSDKRQPYKGERISHLACSLYLFDVSQQSILLVKHNGFGMWLPPGGHVEEGELPHVAALRETFEETNIQELLLLDIKAGDLHLASAEQKQLHFSPETEQEKHFLEPFALVEEKILETDKDVEHFHIDYVYVGQLQSSQDVQILTTEVSDAQWLTLDWYLIDQLDTFPNIKMILKKLLAIRASIFRI